MTIFKKVVYGVLIELGLELIKEYPRFNLYQVNRVVRDKKDKIRGYVPFYNESFTSSQFQEIKNKNYLIKEEVFS